MFSSLIMCNFAWMYVQYVCMCLYMHLLGASEEAQWVKNPPVIWKTQEMWVRSLGQEDPLEEGMATHSSILAWRIPWTGQPGGLQSTGSQRIRHSWSHWTCTHTFINLSHLCVYNFTKKKRNMGAANGKINSSLPWVLLSAFAVQMLFFFFSCCLILWGTILVNKWASLVAQLVKNLPEMQGTLVRFQGQEDPLEKGQATHSSILGLPLWLSWWRIHLQYGRPGFDPWVRKIPWRRERLPSPGLENYLDCIVHGVAKSWAWLGDFHFFLYFQ